MQAYLNIKENDSTSRIPVECKEKPLWWQDRGLYYTASGYGSRIPTRYMVNYNKKWRRVYCIIYSNAGSLFIGKKFNPAMIVEIDSM